MRRLVAATLCAALCGAAGAARAEEPVRVPLSLIAHDLSPETRTVLLWQTVHEVRRGVALRNAGLALTIAGLVGSIVGPVLFVRGIGDGCDACQGLVAGGIGMMTLGPLAAVIGAPMWTAGQRRMNDARRAWVALAPGGVSMGF